MTTMALGTAQEIGAFEAAAARPAVRRRDLRLDFFRGLAMFLILIAHIPWDWAAEWIPARFGFSDSAEMFVFCSGMSSAIAFGAVYREKGWLLGTARVLFRIWQVYWVHIALFFTIAATSAGLLHSGWFEIDHVAELNLYLFFDKPLIHLPALLTLTYVPNFFDILPMYIVLLALIPVVIVLGRLHVGLAAAFVLGLWLFANVTKYNFPAEPLSDRPWFFNPMAWQLVFFTGFAISARWIKTPAPDWRLIWLALAIVLLSVPFAYFKVIDRVPEIQAWRQAHAGLIDKTNFGLFRYVHFLALAYLAACFMGPKGARLSRPDTPPTLIWLRNVLITVGQQSLPVFVFSMLAAILLGALFDAVGRSYLSTIWVNALGFVLLASSAYVVAWFKKKPWKIKR